MKTLLEMNKKKFYRRDVISKFNASEVFNLFSMTPVSAKSKIKIFFLSVFTQLY